MTSTGTFEKRLCWKWQFCSRLSHMQPHNIIKATGRNKTGTCQPPLPRRPKPENRIGQTIISEFKRLLLKLLGGILISIFITHLDTRLFLYFSIYYLLPKFHRNSISKVESDTKSESGCFHFLKNVHYQIDHRVGNI